MGIYSTLYGFLPVFKSPNERNGLESTGNEKGPGGVIKTLLASREKGFLPCGSQ